MNRLMPLTALALVVVVVAFAAAPTARAAPMNASLDLTALRAIQNFALDDKTPDNCYLVVTGVAAGQEVNQRVPREGTWQAAPKQYPVAPGKHGKPAVNLWQGKLDNGQYALLTVTLFHGEGKDAAALKAYEAKLTAARKGVPVASKPAVTADDAKKLGEGILKAHREIVKGIKDIFSREKKTDHFGGQFTILIWNNNGKLSKHLDPVGLTFGEHYGTDVKIYTKLKYTRANVFTQDDSGEWAQEQLAPITDDEENLRVKMLETEYVGPKDSPQRNVTDYLLDVQVKADGKPVKWELGGDHPHEQGTLHEYWDFAV
jgi:hypothetical protein